MLRHKVRNQRRVYEFWLTHQTWKYKSIGNMFNGITKQRVGQIIKKYRELEDNAQTMPR